MRHSRDTSARVDPIGATPDSDISATNRRWYMNEFTPTFRDDENVSPAAGGDSNVSLDFDTEEFLMNVIGEDEESGGGGGTQTAPPPSVPSMPPFQYDFSPQDLIFPHAEGDLSEIDISQLVDLARPPSSPSQTIAPRAPRDPLDPYYDAFYDEESSRD